MMEELLNDPGTLIGYILAIPVMYITYKTLEFVWKIISSILLFFIPAEVWTGLFLLAILAGIILIIFNFDQARCLVVGNTWGRTVAGPQGCFDSSGKILWFR